MSLKNLTLLFLAVFFVSCKPIKSSSPFAHLSTEERIKLADYYHDESMKFNPAFQTGKLHRIYKDSALMAVPDHVEYMQRASYSYKKAGEHIKAMEMLNKAVAIDIKNNSTKALEYKAWSMLYFYRDYENTIKDVDKIIEISKIPNIACHGETCLFLKGEAYYQLGAYQKAIETFNTLLDLQKEQSLQPNEDFYTNFYLGRSYIKSNNIEKGLILLEEQLLMPYTVKTELHFYLGQVYALKNDTEKALKHFISSRDLFLKNDKFSEPYFERFDEIFMEDIDFEISKLQ
ncbi:MAG: tetratricopeptide repeat protein [Myroides sp.]|nr:tetratricopeptide repeat protein [Myroides sp.]